MIPVLPLVLGVLLAGAFASAPLEGQLPPVRFIEPDPSTGSSAASVVSGDVALAHTAQLFPIDRAGRVIGRGDSGRQAAQVLENLRVVLAGVGAGLDDIVKLNVYVTGENVADAVRAHLARSFTGKTRPPATYVSGILPVEGASLAMDAIAVAPANADSLSIHHVPMVYGAGDRGHVAVVPKRDLVYVSGQVARGETLVDAMRETLEASHARIAYLGLSNYDVVQVKVFMNEIARAEEIAGEIAAYYRNKPAPPMVFVEWQHSGSDIEIEIIAATARRQPVAEAVTYTNPPGTKVSPTYSRIAEINRGDLVFLSGLYGDASLDAEGQMRDIFRRMGEVLEKAGSDFEHLLKATYYITDRSMMRTMHNVRLDFYNPDRAPTSSLIPVRGTGMDGRLVNVDMIGVAP